MAEAADEIGCAETTAYTYWRRIFDKTGLRSQREVIAAVLRQGSTGPGSPRS